MYLIENELELKQLKELLKKYQSQPGQLNVNPKEEGILKTLVRRFGRLKEVVLKERLNQVLKREELSYFEGMAFLIQWIGYREFNLHQQLAPALSTVIGLEWDFEMIKELACFLSYFYTVTETETLYVIEVKPFVRPLGDGDFYHLEQDLTSVWLADPISLVH